MAKQKSLEQLRAEKEQGGQRSHTHRNDRADGTHLRSAGGTESRPAHGDYTHQPSKQRKGAESQWHYSTSQ